MKKINLFLFSTIVLIQHIFSNIENNNNLSENIDCARIPPLLWCVNQNLTNFCNLNDQCSRSTPVTKAKPLLLTLFYETLCPNCQDFLADDFPLVYVLFKDYVKVELVPYGNAKRIDETIECQHGEEECKLNRYENCAIHFMPEPLAFISCLESGIRSEIEFEKVARKCYSKFHTIPHIYDQITHCNQSNLGQRLQIESAKRTENAWPDAHEHVPWIMFNNISLKNEQFSLRNLPITICQIISTDNNTDIPPVCKGIGAYSTIPHRNHHHKKMKRKKVKSL